MAPNNPIDFLNTIISEGNNCAFLIGAGISIPEPSSLPGGLQIMEPLLEAISWKPELAEQLKELANPERYNRRCKGHFIRFEALMKIIKDLVDTNLDVLDCLRIKVPPNQNHYTLAELGKLGHDLITTNFDLLLETACHNLNIPYIPFFDFNPENQRILDLLLSNKNETVPIIKLHGSFGELDIDNGNWNYDSYSIMASLDSIFRGVFTTFERQRYRLLQTIFSSKDLFVLGYSGYDDFDISLYLSLIESKRRIIWINHTNDPNKFSVNFWNEIEHSERDKRGNILNSQNNLLYSLGSNLWEKKNIIKVNIDTNLVFNEFRKFYSIKKTDINIEDINVKQSTNIRDWSTKYMNNGIQQVRAFSMLMLNVGEFDLAITPLVQLKNAAEIKNYHEVLYSIEFDIARILFIKGEIKQAYEHFNNVHLNYPTVLGIIAGSRKCYCLALLGEKNESKQYIYEILLKIGLTPQDTLNTPFFEMQESFDIQLMDKCYMHLCMAMAENLRQDSRYEEAFSWFEHLNENCNKTESGLAIEDIIEYSSLISKICIESKQANQAIPYIHRALLYAEFCGMITSDSLEELKLTSKQLLNIVGNDKYFEVLIASFKDLTSEDIWKITRY